MSILRRVSARMNHILLDDGPERERLKKQLHDLIVSVFRKRRHLNYFQVSHFSIQSHAAYNRASRAIMTSFLSFF